MANKLNENSVYIAGSSPKSEIVKTSFTSRLSSLWGWQGVGQSKAENEFEKSSGIRFVKVDVANDAYRVKHAALGSIFKSEPLATNLNKYFNSYLNETTLVYSDIAERQQRLNELRFAVLNDPFLGRVCQLVSDEATQLDDQNRLLSIESPSIQFVNRCYELFSQWGLTQQRISAACYDLEQYGEALWTHRVTEKGVERIIPLKVSSLKERLEFSAAHMAEVIAQMTGENEMMKNRKSKIDKLVNLLTTRSGKDTLNDYDENFADMFDTKLLGFEFADGVVVPPWLVTHFRYKADNSEFFPYGTPPLLMALAPFKQLYSTMALQGLARSASFPVQLYTVKGTEGVGVATAFEQVNAVREEYDNIGVSPMSNSLEVYTINTKIWVPEGLLDLKVIKSEVDMDFIGDIELYEDRVAIASGVPKSYLDQEFGGFGNSGIALTEQYKPFARHVYSIQSAFLEGLGQLIRLHFAITGEFDYNIPFVLSMRFPAEDAGQEKREARSASLELSSSIIEMLQDVLGLEDGEGLPEDVVADILSKYSFLDPTDIQKWMRLSSISKMTRDAEESDEDDDDGYDFGGGGGGSSFGGDFGAGGGIGEVPAPAGPDEGDLDLQDTGEVGEVEALPESMSTEERRYYLQTKKLLNEKLKKEQKKLKEATRRKRLREISERYNESKNDIYFSFLRENHMTEWVKPGSSHEIMVPPINKGHVLYETFAVLKDKSPSTSRTLREDDTLSLKDHLNNVKPLNESLDVMLSTPLKDITQEIEESLNEDS